MSNKLSIQFLLDDNNSNNNNNTANSTSNNPPSSTISPPVAVEPVSPSNQSIPQRRHSLPILQSLASRLDPETSALLQNWQPAGFLKPSWTFLSNVSLSTSTPTSPVASPRGSVDLTYQAPKKQKDLMNYLTFQEHLNQVSSGTKIQQDEVAKMIDSASQKLLEHASPKESNAGEQAQEDEIDVFMRRVRAQAYCAILSNTKLFKQKQHTFRCPFSDDCIKMLKGKGNLRRHLEWHMRRLENDTREQYPQYSTRIKPQTIFHDPLRTFCNIKIPEFGSPSVPSPSSSPQTAKTHVNSTNINNNNNEAIPTTPTKMDVPKLVDEKALELEAAQAMTQLLSKRNVL